MGLRRQYPETPAPLTGRAGLAAQLAELRRSRPARLAEVEGRRHAAAVECARAINQADLARQSYLRMENEAHGAQYLIDLEQHALEKQLEATADPVIDAFLDAWAAAWERRRSDTGDERLTHAEAERFHAVRREVVELRLVEVPDLVSRLGEYARELSLPWLPPTPAA